MIPHLRTFIDAIESAAGKRDACDLTNMEKIALCVERGIELDAWNQWPKRRELRDSGEYLELRTSHAVEFIHDGGNWQVIELK